MTGLIAVRTDDAVHVVTDAATTDLANGALMLIGRKQIITRNGVAIAGTGLAIPYRRFARLAEKRARNFDEVAEIAAEMWKEGLAEVSAVAYASMRPELKSVVCNLIFAGWSEQHKCLAIDVMKPAGEHMLDATAVAVGPPGGDSTDFVKSFIQRFVDDPNSFDPHRDGVEFMQTLRHDYPQQIRARDPRCCRRIYPAHGRHTRPHRDEDHPSLA